MNRMWKYEMTYLIIPFSTSNFSELFNTPGISPAANLFKLRQYLYHVPRIKLRDVDFNVFIINFANFEFIMPKLHFNIKFVLHVE